MILALNEKDTPNDESLYCCLVWLLLVGGEGLMEETPTSQGVRNIHHHVNHLTPYPKKQNRLQRNIDKGHSERGEDNLSTKDN